MCIPYRRAVSKNKEFQLTATNFFRYGYRNTFWVCRARLYFLERIFYPALRSWILVCKLAFQWYLAVDLSEKPDEIHTRAA